ncbi:hypothetical protein BWI97_26505, partial [Siphonobacter sp. BAB-5405]|uniref:hypothetical protein n=1 Tax=Siphonobacter sp. BAB-5405 TaxID=1864825 RepID=UPI000CAE8313
MHADAYAQQLLGISAQADGQMFLKCFQPSSQNQVYSLFEQASREALEVDFTVQRSGEAGQWVRLWGSSGREDESVVLRGVAQAVAPPADLTRPDPLQSFFELFDDSLVGLALLDGKELTYLRVNACYAALKGKTAEELLGKSFPRTLPQGEDLEKSLRQGLSSGVALRVKEV